MNNSARIKHLAFAAIIAAIYAVLTIALAPISYGPIQARVSEALCVIPYFVPQTAWGLFAGCIAANLMTGNVFDVVFGSLATLFASLCTAAIGKKCREKDSDNFGHRLLGCAMPVLFNALIISAVIVKAYNGQKLTESTGLFFLYALQIGAGEAAVMFFLGMPLMKILPRLKIFKDFL